jgi:hypothetical protein
VQWKRPRREPCESVRDTGAHRASVAANRGSTAGSPRGADTWRTTAGAGAAARATPCTTAQHRIYARIFRRHGDDRRDGLLR